MSETPRLSRRELRELGKLQSRPADAESITETTELRLSRPSRKELRELERSQAAEREAVAERHRRVEEERAAREAREAEEARLAEEEARQAEELRHAEEAHLAQEAQQVDQPVPDDQSVQAESVTASETYNDVELHNVNESEITEAVAAEPTELTVASSQEGCDLEAAPQHCEHPSSDTDESTQLDLAQISDGDMATDNEKSDEASCDGAVAGEEAVAEQPARTSVFDRFNDDESESLEDRLLARTRDRAVAATESAELRDGVFDADVHRNTDDSFTGEVKNDDAHAASDDVETVAAHENTVIDDEDADEGSPRRTWLSYILLVLIAIVVGYLAGTWIDKNWLSDAPEFTNTVFAAGQQLL